MHTRHGKKLVNVESTGAVSRPVGGEDGGVAGAESVKEGEEGCAATLEECVMGYIGTDHSGWEL